MTLAHGTDRLESARLVLRRVTPDYLPFFARLHALPEVARHRYPRGEPQSPREDGGLAAVHAGELREARARLP